MDDFLCSSRFATTILFLALRCGNPLPGCYTACVRRYDFVFQGLMQSASWQDIKGSPVAFTVLKEDGTLYSWGCAFRSIHSKPVCWGDHLFAGRTDGTKALPIFDVGQWGSICAFARQTASRSAVDDILLRIRHMWIWPECTVATNGRVECASLAKNLSLG